MEYQIEALEVIITAIEHGRTHSSHSYGVPSRAAIREMAEAIYDAGFRLKSEWISVEDRLPTKEDADKYEHVLAITRDGRVRDWWYELVIFSSKNFTHWMPLPEPPKMKGGAE